MLHRFGLFATQSGYYVETKLANLVGFVPVDALEHVAALADNDVNGLRQGVALFVGLLHEPFQLLGALVGGKGLEINPVPSDRANTAFQLPGDRGNETHTGKISGGCAPCIR